MNYLRTALIAVTMLAFLSPVSAATYEIDSAFKDLSKPLVCEKKEGKEKKEGDKEPECD